jgi:cell division transport system permease protein
MVSNFKFTLREGAGSILRGKFHSFVVAAATALAVAALGLYYYGALNLNRAAEGLLQQLQFEAFVAPSLPETQHPDLLRRIQALDPRWKITYISRAEAAARFAKEFDPQLFDVLKENPLPASFQIALPPQTLDALAARSIAQRLQEVDGIDEVVYDQDLLILFQNGRRKLSQWGLITGIVAVLLALSLTYNAVRLKIDHQREAVRLMSLLGATPGTLRCIYWIQGAVLGAIGGIVAAFVLVALAMLIETRLVAGFHVVGPSMILCVLAGGALGILGGVLAVGKYLKI